MSTASFFELLAECKLSNSVLYTSADYEIPFIPNSGRGMTGTGVVVDRADGYVDLSLGRGEQRGPAHLDTHTPSSAHLLH